MKKILSILLFVTALASAREQSYYLDQLVFQLRDPSTSSQHFRETLEKIGEFLGFQIMERLEKEEVEIETLTRYTVSHPVLTETPVLITILRAGLPLNQGIQKVFPNAEVGFLAMSRNEETLLPRTGYIAIPNLKGKTVILSDTMLATGGSIHDALQIIEQYEPKRVFIVSAIAAEPGKMRILEQWPHVEIFTAAVDPQLNDKGYIIPGLGDAGDRLYGQKHTLSSFEEKH